MPDVKISAGADPGALTATDKVPLARSASTTAYAATVAEIATYANGSYVPPYYTSTPSMDGSAYAGTAAFVSRGDHVHPSDTTRVAKGGDTMTGLLTLSGAPTSNLHAATKLYVDGSAPVGGPYLPLAGGILTGALTPTQTGGLVGTTTNNNANAGSVGEYLTASLASGSALTLVNNTTTNVISVSLTAGDWDVWGTVTFGGGGTSTTLQAWVSTASAAPPASPNGAYAVLSLAAGTMGGCAMPAGITRLSLVATTTVYLGTFATIAAGSVTAYGLIAARRAR